MEFIIQILILAAGFILLVKGADWFVDSAAGIAQKLKVPELVIGLTLVAFGTSAPELAVSLTSALKGGQVGISIGNVVGSNIMNIVLILGLTALFCRIPCHKNSLKLDIPYMTGVTVLFIVLGYCGSEFSRVDGIVLFSLLVAYITILVVISIRTKTNMFAEDEDDDEEEEKSGLSAWFEKMNEHIWFQIIILLIGLGAITWGSDLVVKSASKLAAMIGVPERIIGLTVIAFGTSLPELVTSITAARKGKTDIAIGNILGSNIFNILCVAGFTACLTPLAFDGFLVDSLIALGCALLLAFFCYLPGHTIKRWAGVVMLLVFAGYMTKIVLEQTASEEISQPQTAEASPEILESSVQ